MTRKKIIKEAAADHRDCVCCGFDDPIADAQEASFIVGAEWEHKRLVEKACEWLRKNTTWECNFYGGNNPNKNKIEEFRKAMEE
jgi:hypothetical protein